MSTPPEPPVRAGAEGSSVRLARGSRGEAVRDLQRRLTELGFTLAFDEVAAGEFGPTTEDAVRRFQSERRLRTDGQCGTQTWSALVESGFRLGDRLLYHRHPMLRGDDVSALQRSLNALGFDAGKEDGIFGERTAAALREFQRNAGVTLDGICGPATLDALRRLGPRTGSVAVLREQESLRHGARDVAGLRVFVVTDPALQPVAGAVCTGLGACRAHVAAETAGDDDQSSAAATANRFGADLVLALRPGPEGGPTCAFYESGAYRSQRGHRVAALVLDELARLFGVAAPPPVGRAYPLLRETRAPAVVCEPVCGADDRAVRSVVDQAGTVGDAIVRGIRRAIEEPAGE